MNCKNTLEILPCKTWDKTPSFCLKRQLVRIIGDSWNTKAGYEYVRDTRTRQKGKDLSFGCHESGTQKEVGIELSGSLIHIAQGILKTELNNVSAKL